MAVGMACSVSNCSPVAASYSTVASEWCRTNQRRLRACPSERKDCVCHRLKAIRLVGWLEKGTYYLLHLSPLVLSWLGGDYACVNEVGIHFDCFHCMSNCHIWTVVRRCAMGIESVTAYYILCFYAPYLLLVQSECVVTRESLVTDVALVWFDAWMQLDMLLKIVVSKLLLIAATCHIVLYLVKREPQIWHTWGLGTVVGKVRRRTDWYWPFSGSAGKSGCVNGLPVRVRPTMAPGGGM